MDTNSRMQIADKAMKSFIARYFRDDEDGTGMITGEFYWPRRRSWKLSWMPGMNQKDPYYQELMGKNVPLCLSKSLEDWSNNPFNDDIMWMTIACARSLSGISRGYLSAAGREAFQSGFDRAWSDDLGRRTVLGESRTRRKTPASTVLQ